jgi:hypothetical protein
LSCLLFHRHPGADPLTLNAVSTLVVLVIAVALAVVMNVGNVTGYVAGTIDEEEN